MRLRRNSGVEIGYLNLTTLLISALEQLEGASMIMAPGDIPIYKNANIDHLGVLKDNRIESQELLALIRVVRRTEIKQEGVIEIARGPIGQGKHELTVNVIPLSDDNLVLVLLSDESEAQRVHEIRRDFVANISHELKTPIGALSLLSEAVLGAKDDPEAVKKFAIRMQVEAKRLTDLVQEIIQLSRVQDSDPLKIALELDVNDLIKEAVDQCKTTADARHIWINFLEMPDCTVKGDREQLVMAIHNLIENAVNYSPEKTTVSITSKIQDAIVEISVADQGIGIPETELDRIFERFYRVDPARSRQTGGTGLGLSIVKHVVTKHGGEIKVWSAPNIGSTFSIRLPIFGQDFIKEARP
jgi:two-component system, OmpR family, sensor histidine kinase SenX3|tara:strand:- start:7637 stop:8707 length:1071 start_codon:yes stop_codon:yes gene_type:complete